MHCAISIKLHFFRALYSIVGTAPLYIIQSTKALLVLFYYITWRFAAIWSIFLCIRRESDACQKSIRSLLIIICQKCNSLGLNLAWVPFCCGCLWVSAFRKGSIWWVPLGKEFFGKEFYGSSTLYIA